MTRECLEDLRNGVVLAELGGYGDGSYCARHGAGAAMVVMGTYIVDPGDHVPYPERFVFKPSRAHYLEYLRGHVAAAGKSGAKVAVSVVSVEKRDTIEFLQAAEEAGADCASYCAHSTMAMFVHYGLSSALLAIDRRQDLRDWATSIVKSVSISVLFKNGGSEDAGGRRRGGGPHLFRRGRGSCRRL